MHSEVQVALAGQAARVVPEVIVEETEVTPTMMMTTTNAHRELDRLAIRIEATSGDPAVIDRTQIALVQAVGTPIVARRVARRAAGTVSPTSRAGNDTAQ